MRISQEADYAIRIIVYLYEVDEVTGAKTISEHTKVSLRFASKILRKLMLNGLVTSIKGAAGGYRIKRAEAISLKDVINAVDGDIGVNRCITNDDCCTKVANKQTCRIHNALVAVKNTIDSELDRIKIIDLADSMPVGGK